MHKCLPQKWLANEIEVLPSGRSLGCIVQSNELESDCPMRYKYSNTMRGVEFWHHINLNLKSPIPDGMM